MHNRTEPLSKNIGLVVLFYSMVANEAKRFPEFETIDEMVEFFDNRDLGDYIDQMPEVDFEVDIRRRVYTITLDIDLAETLTEIAKSRQISSEELINSWVREKVLEQATKAA